MEESLEWLFREGDSAIMTMPRTRPMERRGHRHFRAKKEETETITLESDEEMEVVGDMEVEKMELGRPVVGRKRDQSPNIYVAAKEELEDAKKRPSKNLIHQRDPGDGENSSAGYVEELRKALVACSFISANSRLNAFVNFHQRLLRQHGRHLEWGVGQDCDCMAVVSEFLKYQTFVDTNFVNAFNPTPGHLEEAQGLVQMIGAEQHCATIAGLEDWLRQSGRFHAEHFEDS